MVTEDDVNYAFKLAKDTREGVFKAYEALHKVQREYQEEKVSFITRGLQGTNETARKAEIEEHLLQDQGYVDEAQKMVDLRTCEYEMARFEVQRVQLLVSLFALPKE
jgi:hypothetical protein